MLDREEELNAIVQRLKDSLAQREKSTDYDSRNCTSPFEYYIQ